MKPSDDAPLADDTSTLGSASLPTLPGYRLVSLLGQGGMGAVYLAEDISLRRRVAIKVLLPTFVADAKARSRFVREARAMATIEHPNVVRVYGFEEVEDRAYLVMEYVQGESLAARLRREGRLSVAAAVSAALGIAEALDAAWQKGIVHRDVKPSNVLIDTSGGLRVLDFGLARPMMPAEEPLTVCGEVVGTPQYMAPEQIAGTTVDFRADIYSLGILLFELLTGERPFQATTAADLLAQHLGKDLPSLALKRPDAPQGMQDLIERMTRKQPQDRPPSYAAVRESLLALSTRPGRHGSRARTWAIWGGSGVVAVLVFAFVTGDRFLPAHRFGTGAPPTTVGSSRPVRGPKTVDTAFRGAPVDVKFENASIDEVFGFFSEQSGLNFVAEPGIRLPPITLQLTQVPWDQALDLVCQLNGLDYSIEGAVVRITRANNQAGGASGEPSTPAK